MTDSPDADPVLEALANANPIPDPNDLPASAVRADALFEEITMTSHPTDPSTIRDFGPAPSKDEFAPRRARKRGFAITGVAAATAAAVGIGVVALGPGSVPEAHAAMISAAEDTEAARAGTAIITVIADDGSGEQQLLLTTAFDGSDLTATISGDDLPSPLGATPEVRVVDGTIYLSLGDGWFAIDDPAIADLLTTTGLPVDVRDSLSNGIVELVKSASNVEQLDSTHFRATVTLEEARALAADLPSLALFTDRALGAGDLPADVAEQPFDIDLVLDADGLIDVVTIGTNAVDPESGETVNGSVSIDLNDLGSAQTIEAPADAQPLDITSLLGGD